MRTTVTSTGTLRTVNQGIAILREGVRRRAHQDKRRANLQDSDEESIPELLSGGEMVAVGVELASGGIVAVGDTDEDPHEDDGTPASKTMVALEEAGDHASGRRYRV